MKYADFGALENIILPCRSVCSREWKQSTRTFSRIRRIILRSIIFQQYFNFSIIWYHPGLLFRLYITLFKPAGNWGILKAFIMSQPGYPQSNISTHNRSLIEKHVELMRECWRSRKFLFNRYFVLYQYPSRLHWGEILINIKITSRFFNCSLLTFQIFKTWETISSVQDLDPSW